MKKRKAKLIALVLVVLLAVTVVYVILGDISYSRDDARAVVLIGKICSPDEAERTAAHEELIRERTPAMMDRLAEYLGHWPPETYAMERRMLDWPRGGWTGYILRKIGPDAVPAISRVLLPGASTQAPWWRRLLAAIGIRPASWAPAKEIDTRTRSGTAAQMLGEIGDKRALPVLIKALECEDDGIRFAAAAALCKIGDPAAIGPIFAMLKSAMLKDPVRHNSTIEYEVLPRFGKAANPYLIPYLMTMLDRPMDYRHFVRQAMVQAGADCVEGLVSALKDKRPRVRRNAAMILSDIHDARAVEPLIAALADADVDVRIMAISALRQQNDPRDKAPLIGLLRNRSEDEAARCAAAAALSHYADADTVDAFVAVAGDPSHALQSAVATGLGQMGDARAVDALVALLSHESANVRDLAAFALGWLADKRAAEPLRRALGDEDREVRESAIAALNRLGDTASADALAAMMENDADEWVRNRAAIALAGLGDPRALAVPLAPPERPGQPAAQEVTVWNENVGGPETTTGDPATGEALSAAQRPIEWPAWPKGSGPAATSDQKAACMAWLRKFIAEDFLPADVEDHLMAVRRLPLAVTGEPTYISDVFIVRFVRDGWMCDIQETTLDVAVTLARQGAEPVYDSKAEEFIRAAVERVLTAEISKCFDHSKGGSIRPTQTGYYYMREWLRRVPRYYDSLELKQLSEVQRALQGFGYIAGKTDGQSIRFIIEKRTDDGGIPPTVQDRFGPAAPPQPRR